jgi:hypothetical protein
MTAGRLPDEFARRSYRENLSMIAAAIASQYSSITLATSSKVDRRTVAAGASLCPVPG